MAADALHQVCLELLAVCAQAVEATVGGPIERRFVSPGLPAWDCCPQLTVHAGGPAEANTAPLAAALDIGHRANVQGRVNLVLLTITVLRCVPVAGDRGLELPHPSAIEQAAAEVNEDVWAIWNHLFTEKRDGRLFGGKCRELMFAGSVSVATSGGCAGWQIPVQVELDGYRTADD